MRKVKIDGVVFLQLGCGACGDVYYLHPAIERSWDTGLCLSCEHEVRELEGLYGDGRGGLR